MITNYIWYVSEVRGMPLSGWQVLRQRGSHVIVGKLGLRETIPLHKELARGLENKLLKRLRQTRTR